MKPGCIPRACPGGVWGLNRSFHSRVAFVSVKFDFWVLISTLMKDDNQRSKVALLELL
jgi:hypothetical protein